MLGEVPARAVQWVVKEWQNGRLLRDDVGIDHLIPMSFWELGFLNGPFPEAETEPVRTYFPGWDTGHFAIAANEGPMKRYTSASGVEIERGELFRAIPGLEKYLVSKPGCSALKGERAPSVKRARPPSDEAILKKADEMKARGLLSRDIAKLLRLEPGFEHTPNTLARELLKGRWERGRPRKASQK